MSWKDLLMYDAAKSIIAALVAVLVAAVVALSRR